MFNFRESKGGTFFHERGRAALPQPTLMPALRFAASRGGAVADPLTADATDVLQMLARARLDWRVDVREVLMTTDCGPAVIETYRALVRPDTGHSMSVVSRSYRHADNESVVHAALTLAQQYGGRESCLLGAVSFGRDHERTMFIVRIAEPSELPLMLLAYNTHGGEGAVRFQLVEVDGWSGAVLTPAVPSAAVTVPHIGDVPANLRNLVHRRMVEKYVEEVTDAYELLEDITWTPRHTQGLIAELWPQPTGRPLVTADNTTLHHPGEHLTDALGATSTAEAAFGILCEYMDNESEARERGDFTKDRDERLALGAGLRHKQRAWKWMIAHPK